jgi:plasmid stabilization system protein ParE
MARRIVWTEPALEDREAAAEYIAKDSPRYAAAVIREAQDAARSLKPFSRRGHILPEFGDPAIREVFVRSFRLIYQVREEGI